MINLQFIALQKGTKIPKNKGSWKKNTMDAETAFASNDDIAIIIPEGYIVIDIDNMDDAKIVKKILMENNIASLITITDKGMHFWFRHPSNVKINHSAKVRTYLSIEVDPRIGGKGYMVLRHNGVERDMEAIGCQDINGISELPKFLYPDNSKYSREQYGSFKGFKHGDCRVNKLHAYFGHLQQHNQTLAKEDMIQIIQLINDYLFDEPLNQDKLTREVLHNMTITDQHELTVVKQRYREEYQSSSSSSQIKIEEDVYDAELLDPISNIYFASNKEVSPAAFAQLFVQEYGIKYYNNHFYRYNYRTGCYESLSVTDNKAALIKLIHEKNLDLNRRNTEEIVQKVMSLSLITNKDICHNPDLFLLKNGIYNVKTHELTKFNSNMIFFDKIPVEYKPLDSFSKEEVKAFEDYRASLFESNKEEYVHLLDQILGYCFVRALPAQKLFFFWGPGGTGKSTYVNFMKDILGISNTKSISLKQIVENKFMVANLQGKLLNVSNETINKKITETEVLKELSVDSTVEVERKFENAQNTKLYAKHIFCCNDRLLCDDKAFWRRVIVIPFNVVFAGTENNVKDIKLQEAIFTDNIKSYAFAKAMEALKRLQANNYDFDSFEDLDNVLQDFSSNKNHIERFVDELGIDEETINNYETKEFPAMYENYCKNNNLQYPGPTKFKKQFELTLGLRKVRNSKTRKIHYEFE